MSLKDLQTKRSELAETIQKQRDEYQARKKKRSDSPEDAPELWPDETRKTWESVNAEYDSVMEQVRAAEQDNEIESRMRQLEEDAKGSSRGRFDPNAPSGDSLREDEETPRSADEVLHSWARGNANTEELRTAGFGHDGKHLVIGTGDRSRARSIQHAFRSHHPSQAHQRALTTQTGTSGGHTIPEGFVNSLEVALLAFDGMSQVAGLLQTGSGNDLPYPTANDTANEGEIIGENTATATNEDPTFGVINFGAYKFSSKLVKVPYELLEDSAFNFAATLGQMLGERIGRLGERKFTIGTGSSEPNGCVTAATVGVTAAAVAAITGDEIIDLAHSVDPAYRMGASVAYMMNDATCATVRKLKDSDGQYLWQPGLRDGAPDRLNGFRVQINQNMASLAAGSKSMMFGDFEHYKIRRVNSIRIRRADERYVEEDQVGFLALLRQDGDLVNAGTNPVKVLQQAAS